MLRYAERVNEHRGHCMHCALYTAVSCGAYLICTSECRQDKLKVMAILIR